MLRFLFLPDSLYHTDSHTANIGCERSETADQFIFTLPVSMLRKPKSEGNVPLGFTTQQIKSFRKVSGPTDTVISPGSELTNSKCPSHVHIFHRVRRCHCMVGAGILGPACLALKISSVPHRLPRWLKW